MLEVNSERELNSSDYQVNTTNSFYAMSGIFSQLEKISERYVILGELRGELMDVTSKASSDLQQINNFEVSADNPYVAIKDYYAVINNCNYVINNIDTSIYSKGEKILYRDLAAVKAIRAWTYMQIALNYGKAAYFEQPVLNIDDALKKYPGYSITELAGFLIADLQPWKDIENPEYGTIGELSSTKFYFPIRFLLGELYLWTGQYELAATEYHDLIYKKSIRSFYYHFEWEVTGGEFISPLWTTYSDEVLSVIGTTKEYGAGSHLVALTFPYSSSNSSSANLSSLANVMLKPSATSLSYWDNQVYYNDSLVQNMGDLRGRGWSYYSTASLNGTTTTSNASLGRSVDGYDNYIGKFYSNSYGYKNSEIINTCRGGLLYLRYAEAVNRLGKPNLAFAVLKNGLSLLTLSNPKLVPASETGSIKPAYMNFDDKIFDDNIGIHARGCGKMSVVSSYKIPSLAKDDSITYVEDLIVQELALETAFEGNRFQDLMRIALRRGTPSYLADKVAQKYTANKESIHAKLLSTDNWYLPKK
jgi:hypothetical protein